MSVKIIVTTKSIINCLVESVFFGKAFGLMLVNQLMKFFSIKQSNQLTEKACMTYHRASSLFFGKLFFRSGSTISHKEDIFFND